MRRPGPIEASFEASATRMPAALSDAIGAREARTGGCAHGRGREVPPVRTIVLDRPPVPVAPPCASATPLREPAPSAAGPERLRLERREHRLRRQAGGQVGLAVDPPGRGAGADRALGLRQDDAAAHAQPPHRADAERRALGAASCSTARTSTSCVDTTLRSRVAMVFQQPNPFPMSIFDNVAFALREQSRKRPRRRELEPLVIDALRRAGLYDEVRDDLDRPALRLSGGQQQRLCIARAIAPRPEVLLMDEPCSALDPISTGVIEELIHELRRELAVVIVTHNLAQARRVADKVAFMYLGDLVEYGTADQVFDEPRAERTRDYVRGSVRMSMRGSPSGSERRAAAIGERRREP